MAEPTYDEVLKASLNSKFLLYCQVISSFMKNFYATLRFTLMAVVSVNENMIRVHSR